jgi:peptidoglycan/LPS O-acetylase OafA/YrhL
MRSSSGKYYPALDHVRAAAIFMVLSYHCLHGPIPFEGAPVIIPLVFLDEGHTGVALFMTLSGYLFAKILDGHRIAFSEFLWNRFVRLAPLLLVYFAVVGLLSYRDDPQGYLNLLLLGFVLPTWPLVAWSLTAELHFYLLMPAILSLTRRTKSAPLLFVVAMLAIRIGLDALGYDVQFWSYWTIVGRADQFLFGIAAFYYADRIRKRHFSCLAIAAAFTAFLWYCDYLGGYYAKPPLGALWIIIPTVEGFGYAVLIAYYDTSFAPSDSPLSRFLARVGTYSYSIYLFHFLVVTWIVARLRDYLPPNFYLWCAISVAMLIVMMPIGYLSFRFIESPFLKLRRLYVRPPEPEGDVIGRSA